MARTSARTDLRASGAPPKETEDAKLEDAGSHVSKLSASQCALSSTVYLAFFNSQQLQGFQGHLLASASRWWPRRETSRSCWVDATRCRRKIILRGRPPPRPSLSPLKDTPNPRRLHRWFESRLENMDNRRFRPSLETCR